MSVCLYWSQIPLGILEKLLTNSLHISSTKDEMSRLEQLFIEEKFDPQDDQVKPLPELLAIPLNKEVKKNKNESKVSTVNIYNVWYYLSSVAAQKPAKKKKTGHNIIKITSHGGTCPTSSATLGTSGIPNII